MIKFILCLFHSKDKSLPISRSTSQSPSHHHCCIILSNARDTQKPPNVMESATIKSTAGKKDSSTCGLFFKDPCKMGNGLLTSCTEGLGFESPDHSIEESLKEELLRSGTTVERSRWETTVAKVRRQDTKFPPPLSSLNQNGQRCFYLKSVRRNGRLELTEVRIQRPEVLRASRQDGRLRLQTTI
ncbi:hypothetical protein NE237_015199 [Protea cynaroides]|uniref:FAF domain-containing protein n=1 Tax=Protea cynaroides TaxID=273540 RepID=A0A9Q0KDF1_9MAGN|nr:hypothetical protein NE237_015199 [Protea cynaroides]